MGDAFDLLSIQDQEAVKNTYYRYPKITPHIVKYTEYIEVKTIDDKVYLTKLEEVILYIVSEFKFVPIWLIQQWYNDYQKVAYDIIKTWIKVGLVWADNWETGVFLRPTKFLLDMMDIQDQSWVDIPFGLLNHTCAEEQMMFDIMMGNRYSELWTKVKDLDKLLLPCYHPLHIKPATEEGTIIIREANFKCNRYSEKELIDSRNKLKQDILKSTTPLTPEFGNWSLFPIVSYAEKTNKLITQTPDVIIPVPRNNGKAQSYAIELELSIKTPQKYKQIMLNYKNNIVFGKLIYLCASANIKQKVIEAYKEVKGLGTCKLYVVDYNSPAQRMENYSPEDEEARKTMIHLTIKNTRKDS